MLQALSNLVENALRSTPAAGTVRILAAPGRLEVVDDGPRIAEDDLPRAFDRFHLYDRLRAERRVGTGLGLAIVRELVGAWTARPRHAASSASAPRSRSASRSPPERRHLRRKPAPRSS